MRKRKKRAKEERKSRLRIRGWMVAALVVLSAGTYEVIRRQTPGPEAPVTIGSTLPAPPAVHQTAPSLSANRSLPPYHESAQAAKPFRPLVPASYFRRYPLVARAYRIAAEIPAVIAQQPCYCHCDRLGHRSLLDCYASDHGAG